MLTTHYTPFSFLVYRQYQSCYCHFTRDTLYMHTTHYTHISFLVYRQYHVLLLSCLLGHPVYAHNYYTHFSCLVFRQYQSCYCHVSRDTLYMLTTTILTSYFLSLDNTSLVIVMFLGTPCIYINVRIKQFKGGGDEYN